MVTSGLSVVGPFSQRECVCLDTPRQHKGSSEKLVDHHLTAGVSELSRSPFADTAQGQGWWEISVVRHNVLSGTPPLLQWKKSSRCLTGL